jgi:NADH-quinone oxidoreductase subunit C
LADTEQQPESPQADWPNAVQRLQAEFGDVEFAPAELVSSDDKQRGQVCVRVPAGKLEAVMRFLHDDANCAFDMLADVTCVDYLYYPDASDRFGVTYTLVSTRHNQRLWVKCFANDPDPEVPSMAGIWKGADWPEREVYDLFGVKFAGHPDLRRLMTWEGFGSHPLRKDYPLRGKGERENYPVYTRTST